MVCSLSLGEVPLGKNRLVRTARIAEISSRAEACLYWSGRESNEERKEFRKIR